ncbi:MAG: hypothetical protein UV02_C0047G0002 [Candidatus Kuenenbacteria bacterium GW2011_GWA2_42_15]|uniref:Uncharacterized protein n=1 Tax=Candidatus Kuenenbacteria bacterium GW2011_GWA2_42_15 TaxID=1618677 RepID=A0A0G1BRJ5_9BACT|nr:MAG: hypothetical protein UV02_C0047G0002 [Candidatus Kuenenbacteria bacterium GW2011_GWA2_42_15]
MSGRGLSLEGLVEIFIVSVVWSKRWFNRPCRPNRRASIEPKV